MYTLIEIFIWFYSCLILFVIALAIICRPRYLDYFEYDEHSELDDDE